MTEPPAELSPQWSTAAPMPEALRWFGATMFRDQIYVGGGAAVDGTGSNRVYRYDPPTDTWDRIGDLPSEAVRLVLAVLSDSLYAVLLTGPFVFPGMPIWVYLPDTDQWELRTTVPLGRVEESAIGLAGEIAIARWDSFDGHSLDLYSPATDEWRTAAPPPIAPTTLGQTLGVAGGRLYMIGGFANSELTPAVSVFDPALDTWRTVADMPTARFAAGVTAVDGRIHVLAGATRTDLLTAHEAYDPITESWTTLPSVPTARLAPQAVTVNGRIYLLGGDQSAGLVNVVEVFTPE